MAHGWRCLTKDDHSIRATARGSLACYWWPMNWTWGSALTHLGLDVWCFDRCGQRRQHKKSARHRLPGTMTQSDAPTLEISSNMAGGLASSDVVGWLCDGVDHNQLAYFQGFAKETMDAIYSRTRLDGYRIPRACVFYTLGVEYYSTPNC